MWGGSWSLHAVSGVIHPWPSASACHSSHLRHLAFTQWVSHALIIAVRHRGLHTAVSVLWWAVLMIQAQWRSACSVVASPVSRAGGCFQGFSTLWCFGWMTLYQCNNVLNNTLSMENLSTGHFVKRRFVDMTYGQLTSPCASASRVLPWQFYCFLLSIYHISFSLSHWIFSFALTITQREPNVTKRCGQCVSEGWWLL